MSKSRKIIIVLTLLLITLTPVAASKLRAYVYMDRPIWAECTEYNVAVKSIEGSITLPYQMANQYARCYGWAQDPTTQECYSYYEDVQGNTYVPYLGANYTDSTTHLYYKYNYAGCNFEN